MKKLFLITMFIWTSMFAFANGVQGATVPHYLNYQSLLYDDGGNLIANGPAGITFRITDSAGSTLFEEYQTLEVVNGAVSAIVGNGLDGNDAPVGGVPTSVLDPASSRFLEVTVDNFPPQGLYEIVSVPYSYYASEAASVADGGVNGAAIASGALTLDHFSASLLGDLATELAGSSTLATSTDLTNMQSTYRSTTGASAIGVTAGFVYSGASNVQDVLLDLDRAVQRRQAGIDAAIVTSGATQTALTTHTDATTGVHGVSGDIVGTTDAQSLSNKTLNSPTINSPTINTPTIVGGTLSGTTAGGYDVAGTLDDHERRITELEIGEAAASQIEAWGIVTGETLGANDNIEQMEIVGIGMYRITFVDALPSANYAVSVAPHSAKLFFISSKTNSSFVVSFILVSGGQSPSDFDFSVIQ